MNEQQELVVLTEDELEQVGGGAWYGDGQLL